MTFRDAKRHGESGTATIEFAIVLPMMLLLVFGIIEIGRYAYFSIAVSNAARAGVQYGAQNMVTADDSTGMQNAALGDAYGISGLTATATHTCSCSDGTASTCQASDCSSSHRLTYVKVTTSGTFQSLLHFPGVPSSFSISSTAVMRAAE